VAARWAEGLAGAPIGVGQRPASVGMEFGLGRPPPLASEAPVRHLSWFERASPWAGAGCRGGRVGAVWCCRKSSREGQMASGVGIAEWIGCSGVDGTVYALQGSAAADSVERITRQVMSSRWCCAARFLTPGAAWRATTDILRRATAGGPAAFAGLGRLIEHPVPGSGRSFPGAQGRCLIDLTRFAIWSGWRGGSAASLTMTAWSSTTEVQAVRCESAGKPSPPHRHRTLDGSKASGDGRGDRPGHSY